MKDLSVTGIAILGCLSTMMVSCNEKSSAKKSSTERPNFIIILADDMGYSDASAYGGWIKTPSLEKMVKEGMKFTDFYSNGAVCSPTRAALMTGRYQQRVGIEDVLVEREGWFSYGLGLSPSEPTIASIMHDAGYRTAIFGKWHLGSRLQYNPVNHGFEEFRGYLPGAIDYVAHSHSWWNGLKQEDEKGYTTHLITNHSVEYIKEHQKEPFFLYVAYEAVHLPWQAPGDGPFTKPYKDWTRDEIAEKYNAMGIEMDKGIGQILQTIEECGISKNTFVFFFSDNGGISEVASNKPYRGFKAQLYEGGIRIPAIAYWPGKIPGGTVTSQPAAGMDLLPTIADIAGVPLPEGRKFDGVSLRKVILEQKVLPPRKLFWGYEARGTAMRDGDWKFLTLKNKGWELYNLSEDPGESNDLSGKYPEKAGEMYLETATWLKDVHSKIPLKAWGQ